MSKNVKKVKDIEIEKQRLDLYLTKFVPKVEEKNELIKLFESLSPFGTAGEVEKELNRNNANNSNGILSSMKDFEQMVRRVDSHLDEAKGKQTLLKFEIESVSQIISSLISIIQQEINFDNICKLYKDLTSNQLIFESKMYFLSENNKKVLFSVKDMWESADSLYESVFNREQDIKTIYHFIHIMEDKKKIASNNGMTVYMYGVNQKLIDPLSRSVFESIGQTSGSRNFHFDSVDSVRNEEREGIVNRTINKLTAIFHKNKEKKEDSLRTVGLVKKN